MSLLMTGWTQDDKMLRVVAVKQILGNVDGMQL